MENKKRLIDANDAVKAVTDIYCGTAGYRARERLWDAVEAVKNIPTVDAAPVVHGRWMPCGFGREIMCSVCRCELNDGWEYRYCPDCGAKMDLKE